MNPKFQFASYALWIAHPVLQALVAAAMVRRKLHRKFPVFFGYILFQIVTFPILFFIYRTGSYALHFYVFWTWFAIMLAVGFKVIHEVFLDVFRPYHTLKDLGTVLFKWAALVMLLVAGVVAAASPSGQDPLVQAVMTVQRCVRVTQCGLILFLIVFSRYLGVSRRQHSFGIALGFGGFASVELVLLAFRAASYIDETRMNLANMAAYNCAIVVWFGYMLAKGVAREAPSNLLTSQRWEQSLAELQRPASADSLIPMFEGMVDRAFSRSTSESSTTHDESSPEPVSSHKETH
jgi:hypothetical protein